MIETPRLILRPWRKTDLPPFAEQNADLVVMQFLTGVLTREASDAYVERAEKHLAENGFASGLSKPLASRHWLALLDLRA